MQASLSTDYSQDGFHLANCAIAPADIEAIRGELLSIGRLIGDAPPFNDVDAMWNHYKSRDRAKASLIYNGFKFLPSIGRLALSDRMAGQLADICGIRKPALVDVNCRIDSFGEGKYLFGWHQDYWFSVCSTRAAVVWIPVMGLDPGIGGLEVVSNRITGGRVLKTRQGEHYNSYADAVVLDEALPACHTVAIDGMAAGDALFFSFSLLHRSLPVLDPERSRFTVQLRFADFEDAQFIDEKYRPGTVTSARVDYLKKANT